MNELVKAVIVAFCLFVIAACVGHILPNTWLRISFFLIVSVYCGVAMISCDILWGLRRRLYHDGAIWMRCASERSDTESPLFWHNNR